MLRKKIPELSTPVRGRSASPRVATPTLSGKKRGRSSSAARSGSAVKTARRGSCTPGPERSISVMTGNSMTSGVSGVSSTPAAKEMGKRPVIIAKTKRPSTSTPRPSIDTTAVAATAALRQDLEAEKNSTDFLLQKIRTLEATHTIDRNRWAAERIMLQEQISELKKENARLKSL
eukprot:TRINITY_DN6443_c0_g1_i2.p1 TRINITY_DN6443_c0_g1~~TRINITY_DN6443_c0_g1_i2.p1  ORF type:complete len:175 (+),score=38.92 TRINITY_DN6443_c0_g1_i2:53-577(+)